MKFSNRTRGAVALTACVAVGAAGGIAGSAAAPSTSSKAKSSKSSTSTTAKRTSGRRAGPPRRGSGHAVHAEAVVLNKARDAFITVTTDNGKIKSVSGNDVTITEAIGSVTYKDVKVTLPSDATIRRNGATAKVGDLKDGDRIHVAQSSDGTSVRASDASFKPRGPGHRGPRRHR